MNFSGRATRSQYWFWVLFLIVVEVVGMVLAAVVADIFNIVTMVAVLALLIPSIAVSVRRLHDIDKSGWMLLLNLVPFGGLYVLYLNVQPSKPGPNRFGPELAATSAM